MSYAVTKIVSGLSFVIVMGKLPAEALTDKRTKILTIAVRWSGVRMR